MKALIKTIDDEGKFIVINNGMRLIVNYYNRSTVSLWNIGEEINLFEVMDVFWPYNIVNLPNNQKCEARKTQQDYSLVPKDKFDINAVERLSEADPFEIQLVLPELFDWTRDPNWPIAYKLASQLANFGDLIIPYLKHFLSHTTGSDEYAVFDEIMPRLSIAQIGLLKPDLERLAYEPTWFEQNEEYDKFALSYLSKLSHQ